MAGIPFFVEPFAFTIDSATTGPTDRPASHLADFYYIGMVWQSNATTTHQVTVDLGSARSFNHISLLGTNAQAGTRIRVSAGATAANAAGATPTYDSGFSTLISPAVTGRDSYNGFLSIAAQTFRYVSIRIDTHSGVFEAAKLVIGTRIAPTNYYETDWEAGPEDLGALSLTRSGVPEVITGRVLRRLGFKLAWLSEAEHDATIQPMLRRLGRRNPVLLCFDPDATVYRQERTYFGFLTDVSRARKLSFNRFEKSFEILSLI